MTESLGLRHRHAQLILTAIFLIWAAFVLTGVAQHTVWRDEMRALSLALRAPNLLGVPAAAQGEGHPVLWYLLLRIAYDTFHTKAVLQGLGLTFAAAGVALMLWRAPFPIWWRCLFVFSGLAVFEYAVMDRNYGICMPLMFGLAMLIGEQKKRYGFIAALIFLTTQTNIYATLLAPLYVLVLLPDWRNGPKARIGIAICGGAALVGLALAVAAVYPPRHDLVTASLSLKAPLWKTLVLSISLPGFAYLALINGHALAVWTPYLGFGLEAIVLTLLMYGICAGLLPNISLAGAAVIGACSTAAFAALVYPMYYRHSGIWLIFVVSLYWIRAKQISTVRGGYRPSIVLSLLLVVNLYFGIPQIFASFNHPQSDSRSLATVIEHDPSLRRAILLPEPGEYGESVLYYVGNPMYLIREHGFGTLATWRHGSIISLSLRDLLQTAEDLKKRWERPVVIMLQEPLIPKGGVFLTSFGRTLHYTPADYADFIRATQRISMPPAPDEQFAVYVIR